MPELPEVETVRQGLIPEMNEKIIVRLDQRRLDLRWPLPKNMSERLTNSRILGISRRSKYLLFTLSNGETLIIHLGMSGRLLAMKFKNDTRKLIGTFDLETGKFDKHDHIIFFLDSDVAIIYNDPRRFGAMDLIPTLGLDNHKWLRRLGPEPLSNNFSSKYLYEKLKQRKSSVKAALMDQTLIAGLGNIYVLEALWLSKISPFRRADDIKKIEAEAIAISIKNVLVAAIEAGGTSLQDFRQVGGEIGYFQRCLNVYGCSDTKCKNIRCSGTIQRVKQLGRTSYFCSNCQK